MRRFILAAMILGTYELALGVFTYQAHPTLRGTDGSADVQSARRERDDAWRRHLDVVQQELDRGRVDVAVRVWHDARNAALASGTWEAMVAVGDVFVAIGRASGAASGARLNARDAYTTALTRARRAGSVDGVLRSAEGFRELGDVGIADRCLRIAEQLADGDSVRQEVRDVRRRWASRETVTDF